MHRLTAASKRSGRVAWWLVGVVVLTSVATALEAPTADNLHVVQAAAFLDGQLAIDRQIEDVAVYEGELFSPYPPFPALLLAPLVAVFGSSPRVGIVAALLLTAVNVVVLGRLAAQWGATSVQRWWLVVGALLGTAYWTAVLSSGGVWFLSHVVAFTCLLLAVHEVTARRPLSGGLLLGLAFLSRQPTIFAVPFLVALVATAAPDRRRTLRDLTVLLVPVVVSVAGYLAFNAARFSGPLDTGYSYIALGEPFLVARVDRYGLFDFAYVPFNFVHLFLQGFSVEFTGDRLVTLGGVDPFGTSLTFASPFVFLAAVARLPPWVRAGAAAAVGLIVVIHLTYYNNGFVQANAQRFSLDYLPILILLLAAALQRVPERLWKGLIAYAIALNVIGLAVVPRIAPWTARFG